MNPKPPGREIHFAVLFTVVFLAAFVALGKRALDRHRAWDRDHPYSALARKLNEWPEREWCDVHQAPSRTYAAAVEDRFRDEIKALWQERGGGGLPTFSLLDLGVVKLRINPKQPPAEGFDASSFSWGEAVGIIKRTQQTPDAADNRDRWRDLDSMVRFLFEKDYARLVYRRPFLAPEITEHEFRPTRSVTRTGEHEFTVQLAPGDFAGHETALQRLLEAEWQGGGNRVKLRWGGGEGIYRLVAHHDSNRSFVNHRTLTMNIANLAWTKTVAHELGHVLGFDDHYYNVWEQGGCYYSQKSRRGDLMSNSEHGTVTPRHWELLDKAYPWQRPALREPFTYTYGK